jgi:hypothetical protein
MTAFAFGNVQYASEGGYISVEMMISEEMVSKVISGQYRGLSPEWRVRKWECSICHENLEDCPHEVGKRYDDLICEMIARDIDAIGLSIVAFPADPRCRIIDMLLVKNGKNPEYVWYGFRVNSERERFENIQKAREKGLIPENVAFFFAEYFTIHLEGKAVFS